MIRFSPLAAGGDRIEIAALVRSNLSLVIAGSPLAVALLLAYRDGGYFLSSWGIAAVAMLGALATTVLVREGDLGGRLGLAAVAAWALLAAWQGVSALWSYEPAASTEAMGLTLLYGATFALVLAAAPGARELRRILDLALLGAVVVSLTALGARLLPGLISGDDNGRLSTPLTYWNNLALIFAFGFIIAVGIAADPSRGRLARMTAAAAVPMFPLGILFTQSRGGLLVLIVGSLALLALAPGRIETACMLAIAGCTCVPLMIFASGRDALSPNRVTLEPHEAEGRQVALALVGAAVVCALGALAVGPVSRLLAQGRRRVVVGGSLGAVALVLLVAVLIARPPAGGPVDWADRQFQEFKRYDPRARDNAVTVADKLAVSAGSGRWQNWSVAADQFTESPIVGTGAGDFRFRWAAERDIDVSVRNAHSLYLETLGDSGLVGIVLLLLPLAAVGAAVGLSLRRRRIPPPLARDLAIVSAAGAAVALHVAGDWGWQMPAVVLPAIVLGAAALTASRTDLRPSPAAGRAPRWAIAGLSVVAILLLAGPIAASGRLDVARRHAASGDLTGALSRARSAVSLDPQSAEARALEANVLSDLGRPAQADAAFGQAVARSPRDWSIYADWATALIGRGNVAAARVLITRAVELNPRDGRLAVLRQQVRT